MDKAEQFSALIGDIYDAALDSGLWPDVLAKCAAFVGGPAAVLFSKDTASKTGDVTYYAGIEEHYKRLCFEKYIKLDPLTIGHYFAKIEQPVSVGDILPYDEFLETRAYREWGEPQGFIDVLFIHKAALDAPSPSEVIAKAYKLTPTDQRALLAVVEIGGVPEVAEALGIAESTVKTHLGRVYRKTATARQADLVKLVAGYSNSFIS
jgi:DNA-binding CsgD family transcriptional regulator